MEVVVLYYLLDVFGQKRKCGGTLKSNDWTLFMSGTRFIFRGFLTLKSTKLGMNYSRFFCEWLLASVEVNEALSRP